MSNTMNQILPGAAFIDSTSGPVTIRGLPRYVPGGYVVDVSSVLWNGSVLFWTACVENLRAVP
jgi:hypothetical protein